jgi:diguanylate cyclase (GGDEF)-like protein/PAS domain S-box-containing protein
MPRVLVVEDHLGDVELIRGALGAEPGLDVRCVGDLRSALAALAADAPSLLLADLDLPDSAGMATLDGLLEATGHRVPVVVLTGDRDERTGREAIERGAHDFLHKDDVRPGSLARCVRYALSARRAVDAASPDPLASLLASDVAMAVVDVEGTLLEITAGLEQLIGRRRGEVVGTALHQLAVPADRRRVRACFAPPLDSGPPVEADLVRADGARLAVTLASVAMGAEGLPAAGPCWAVLVHDVTAQREAEAARDLRGRLLDAVGEAVLAADASGAVVYANEAARRLFAPADDLRGRPLQSLLPVPLQDLAGQLAAHQEPLRLSASRRVGDRDVDLHVTLTPTADAAGLVDGWIVVAVDVTEQADIQRALAHQAVHDPLTGLASRPLLMRRVELMLERGRQDARVVALTYLDLDGFKALNDTHGHEWGDQVLRAVAATLVEVAGPGNTVARLGGDEFVVCWENLEDEAQARREAERIAAALRRPAVVEGIELRATASVGLAAAAPGAPISAESLLRNADAAMYQAKERGRDRVEVWDAQLESRFERRIALREALLHMSEDELEVHYQPIVRLSTGALHGFEALLRWNSPRFGTVSPAEFIPIAEETGLILVLGRVVLGRACAQLAAWRTEHPEADLTMSVNLSARQLTDPDIVDFVADLLRTADLDPAALTLEITETVLMEHADESAVRLRQLKALGVRIAIDDFGTGYSSLAYLRRLPLDCLKIDREFVRGLGTDPEDAIIVASITTLASSLGLAVVGEGVERTAQRDALATLGCDLGQGWLWSAALPAEEVEGLLSAAGWEAARTTGATADELLADVAAPDGEEVASVLRHELGNPLQVIKLYTDLIRPTDDAQVDELALQRAIGAIGRSARDIELVLGDLADVRSVAAGTVALDRRPVDLAELVDHVVETTAEAAAQHHVHVVAPPAPVLGECDASRVRQILHNLVRNALRHTPPGTTVVIRTAVGPAHVEVVVGDDGPGIPPEKVPLLFRKFSRLHRTISGTGLGLYLARGLARAHGGDLRYRPADGGGSEFVLTLPAVDRAAVPTAV